MGMCDLFEMFLVMSVICVTDVKSIDYGVVLWLWDLNKVERSYQIFKCYKEICFGHQQVLPGEHVIDQGDDGDNFYVIDMYVGVVSSYTHVSVN